MKTRLILPIIGIVFLPFLGFSQTIEWQNTIGGQGYEGVRSIRQTADGGYILGGFSSSDIGGDKTENTVGGNGLNDYWIVKTDAYGVIQWQNTIGGDASDWCISVEQTSDGGYIIGGTSESDNSGDKSENSQGGTDFWIVKVDSSGVLQWDNTIGGSNTDEFSDLQQTSDGGYILGGRSLSDISGDKTENSNGFFDYWMVKINATGSIQWQNTIGGSNSDQLTSIEQTDDGGYILGGYSLSDISGDKTENSNGPWDYWIVKTDSLGNIEWQNTIGGNDTDDLQTLQQTADGGYILGGQSVSDISGDKTENSNGSNDCWIVKIDDAGNLEWQNTIGGNDIDYLISIDQTLDNGYILGGYSQSNISGDKNENSNGLWDYWIIKTDMFGDIQWQNTIGGGDEDLLFSIQQTADGGYILGGESESNISGDKTENGFMNSKDYWIVKLNGQQNYITGKLFIDANSNGTQEAGETPAIYKQVTEINTGFFSYSNQTGSYIISVFDSGSFTVTPVAINYYTPVPASHNATFTGLQQTDSLNDFAFQPAGVYNDLCVNITPIGPFRAGFNADYMITYENEGTTTLSPTVIFYRDASVNYVSSIPAASTVAIDSVVWNFGPLAPFESGSILVTVSVSAVAPIGTLINSGAHIEPLAGDANPICNQAYWEIETTGSYDPNDILVDQDTLFTAQFPNPPFLDYIIRFQNTGNDTAFTVKVLNPIDTFKLEVTTLEFTASSHPVNLNWIPWERNMEFMFENILLPDSNINEPASHGFIRYRIKPKSTLTAGNIITNYAAIYFDFNAPVITNTAITRVVLPTMLNELSTTSDNLLLYPNPTNSILTIEINMFSSSAKLIQISDIEGRKLLSIPLAPASDKHILDISFLSKGIYFVQVGSDEKIERGRFVIN